MKFFFNRIAKKKIFYITMNAISWLSYAIHGFKKNNEYNKIITGYFIKKKN